MWRQVSGVLIALLMGAAALALGQGDVQAESQPDLAVIGVVVGPPAVYPGQKFAVKVRIKNNGLAATTRSCTVRLRLSQTYPSNGNVGIGTTTPSGSLYTESSEFSVSLPPLGSLREWQWSSVGSWTPQAAPVRAGSSNSISVTVDATNLVPETNEANNRSWTSYSLLGRDWYVSPTGNDVTGDGSNARPFATAQRAAASAQPGDHFYIPSSSASSTADLPAWYDIPPPPPCPDYTKYGMSYSCPPQPPEPVDSLWYCTISFGTTPAYNNFKVQGGWEYGCAVILGDRKENPYGAETMVSKYIERYQLKGKVKVRFFSGGYEHMIKQWFDPDAPTVPNDSTVTGVALRTTF